MLPDTVTLQPPVFDAISVYGIGGIAVLVALAWIVLFSGGNRSRGLLLVVGAALVMGVSAAAAFSGLLSRFDFFPPPMAIMMAWVFLLGLGSGFSALGRRAAENLTFASLIGLQAFRFPLELVMHRAYTQGIMPIYLSYSGYNLDIVTGVGALIIFAFFRMGRSVPRSLLWIWNIWGSACLVVLAVIAIAISPMVRAFGDAPADVNSWVLYFPYVWLPVVLVTIAISGHVIVWRKLFLKTAM